MRYVWVALMSVFLAACQSTGNPTKSFISLSDALDGEGVLSLPYDLFRDRIFTVRVNTADGRTLPFLIDTGATKSAVFRGTLSKLKVKTDGLEEVTIHGMHDYASRPLVTVPKLYLADRELTDFQFAVLENREFDQMSGPQPAGLIGMDILSDYRVYVDADTRTFNLIPRSLPQPKVPYKWDYVSLESNPFNENDHGLHFLNVRVGNYLIPALLDTGSEDNLMNWKGAQFPQLKRARKRLYDQWLQEGAVGSFEPSYSIRVKNLRSGQKFWDSSDFVVVNFDGLEILGIDDEPFLIAGAGLFAEQTFYLDFAQNVIRFKPERVSLRGRTLTSTSTVYKSKDVEQ